MDDARERADADGVRSRRRPAAGSGAWLLWPVLVFVILALGTSVYFLLAPVDADSGGGDGGDARSATEATAARAPAAARVARPTDGPRLDATDEGTPDETPPAPEDAMAAPGPEPSGIALFPAPGTKPVKRGILVPEDFPLPPGYVRHYQTTDDGRQLPAILMFHPDFVPRDARGEPVPVPRDRVVPPELAPPGLPIELLDPSIAAPPHDPESASP